MRLFRDSKWYEDLGHVLIGLLAPMWGAAREEKQWPPATNTQPVLRVWGVVGTRWGWQAVRADAPPEESFQAPRGHYVYVSAIRVRDAYRDFTGYLLGSQIAIVALIIVALVGWLR